MAAFTSFSLFIIHFFILHACSKTHWQDIQVLKQLKASLQPNSVSSGSCVSSWDFAIDPCDNLFSDKFTCGFRCDAVESSSYRVTELSLDQAGYSGSLTSVSWDLPYLEILDFSSNYFYGSVPESFSGLPRLKRLGLSRNTFSGLVPDSLGELSSLEELYLDGNSLEGTIPLSLNGLKNLKRLEIQGNRFSGEFPNLSQLSSLYFLYASDNAISGKLPGNFPASLVELSMRNNSIEGTIPLSVVNLAYLQVLDLSHNRLSGSVPPSLFTHPSLQQLTLSYNQFESVKDPGTTSLSSQLIAIDLSNNEIRGFLPGFMGLMPRLSALSFENNKVSGFIPVEYAMKIIIPGQGIAQFERLLLVGNYLYGPIPGSWLDLKPGSVMVRLGDNCLYRCPLRFFLCEGGEQKSMRECRAFGLP